MYAQLARKIAETKKATVYLFRNAPAARLQLAARFGCMKQLAFASAFALDLFLFRRLHFRRSVIACMSSRGVIDGHAVCKFTIWSTVS